MKFTYQARTKEGEMRSGQIEASSREAAIEVLQKYNIFITSLKEVKNLWIESRKMSLCLWLKIYICPHYQRHKRVPK